MRFASVCSGIDSASVAWIPLSWAPVLFSEIAPFPCAVLAHHYPQVPNLGDLNGFRSWPDANFDVLVGGTPCQSFSVAGFREGLGDPRGNLALVYLEILRRYRPRWFVWENVPGVLSSDQGRDLGSLFGGVAELGYGYAWRTLDAQYFGVPQRRRRVFVVGCLGSWAHPAAVLFEPESLRGNLETRRKSRTDHSGTLTASARRSSSPEFDNGQLVAGTLNPGAKPGGYNGQDAFAGLLIPDVAGTIDTAHSFRPEHAWGGKLLSGQTASGTVSPKWRSASGGPSGAETPGLIAFDRAQLTHPENRSRPMPGEPCPTTIGSTSQPCIAFDAMPARGEGGSTVFLERDTAASLRAISPGRTDRGTRLHTSTGIRRFTPLECERLQGFPDHYTAIEYRGKPAADAPRYEAIGNAIATVVLRWIGERLQWVEQL